MKGFQCVDLVENVETILYHQKAKTFRGLRNHQMNIDIFMNVMEDMG